MAKDSQSKAQEQQRSRPVQASNVQGKQDKPPAKEKDKRAHRRQRIGQMIFWGGIAGLMLGLVGYVALPAMGITLLGLTGAGLLAVSLLSGIGAVIALAAIGYGLFRLGVALWKGLVNIGKAVAKALTTVFNAIRNNPMNVFFGLGVAVALTGLILGGGLFIPLLALGGALFGVGLVIGAFKIAGRVANAFKRAWNVVKENPIYVSAASTVFFGIAAAVSFFLLPLSPLLMIGVIGAGLVAVGSLIFGLTKAYKEHPRRVAAVAAVGLAALLVLFPPVGMLVTALLFIGFLAYRGSRDSTKGLEKQQKKESLEEELESFVGEENEQGLDPDDAFQNQGSSTAQLGVAAGVDDRLKSPPLRETSAASSWKAASKPEMEMTSVKTESVEVKQEVAGGAKTTPQETAQRLKVGDEAYQEIRDIDESAESSVVDPKGGELKQAESPSAGTSTTKVDGLSANENTLSPVGSSSVDSLSSFPSSSVTTAPASWVANGTLSESNGSVQGVQAWVTDGKHDADNGAAVQTTPKEAVVVQGVQKESTP